MDCETMAGSVRRGGWVRAGAAAGGGGGPTTLPPAAPACPAGWLTAASWEENKDLRLSATPAPPRYGGACAGSSKGITGNRSCCSTRTAWLRSHVRSTKHIRVQGPNRQAGANLGWGEVRLRVVRGRRPPHGAHRRRAGHHGGRVLRRPLHRRGAGTRREALERLRGPRVVRRVVRWVAGRLGRLLRRRIGRMMQRGGRQAFRSQLPRRGSHGGALHRTAAAAVLESLLCRTGAAVLSSPVTGDAVVACMFRRSRAVPGSRTQTLTVDSSFGAAGAPARQARVCL